MTRRSYEIRGLPRTTKDLKMRGAQVGDPSSHAAMIQAPFSVPNPRRALLRMTRSQRPRAIDSQARRPVVKSLGMTVSHRSR